MSYNLKEIHTSIVEAFDQPEFERLVKFCLEQNTSDIAQSGGGYRGAVYDVILWAERNGSLGKFITAAKEENPGNEALSRISERSLSEYKDFITVHENIEFRLRRLEESLTGVGRDHGLRGDLFALKTDLEYVRRDLASLKARVDRLQNSIDHIPDHQVSAKLVKVGAGLFFVMLFAIVYGTFFYG